jgi:hypothetical protein
MFLFTETQKEVLENVSDQQTSEKIRSKVNQTEEMNLKKTRIYRQIKRAQEGLSSSSASQKNNGNFQESDKSD